MHGYYLAILTYSSTYKQKMLSNYMDQQKLRYKSQILCRILLERRVNPKNIKEANKDVLILFPVFLLSLRNFRVSNFAEK